MAAASTSTPPTIDFDRLLAPLNGEAAGGGLYADLKTARNQAANLERTAEVTDRDDERTSALAALDGQWRKVRELAEKVLADEAKDLGAAAFLADALLRTDGFAGLRDAFRLTRQLVEAYWEQICPPLAEPENTDDPAEAKRMAEQARERMVKERLGLLASLNGRERDGSLILPLRREPLTEPRDGADKGPFSLSDYMEAKRLGGATNDSAREKGAALRADIEQEVARSSAQFLLALRDDLRDCLAEFNALALALQERSGLGTAKFSGVFPASNIDSVLKECLAIAERNAEHRAPAEPSASAAAEGKSADAGSPAQANGSGQTREGALRTLEGLAQFFERTDPHSPLAPALRQIVRWARTPLGDLYAELIPDEDARKSLFKLIGVKPPETEEGR